jgi:pimeloyl-ACP methyl ester carboxylesterase
MAHKREARRGWLAPGLASTLPGLLRHVTSRDGTRIACETGGSGPPVVLVHGAGSARWTFDLVRPLLEGDFTVIAIDRRGRGDSGDGDGDGYSLESEYDDVAAVVRDAGAGALLVGHSYGGLISAGAAPLIDGLPKLVLYEPPMGGVLAAPSFLDRLELLLERGERDRLLREYLAEIGGYSEAEIEAMAATPTWDARLAISSTLPRELRAEQVHTLDSDRLAGIRTPVLMLLGSESPPWARQSTAAYADALPDCTVRTLDGQGHGAAVTAPELLVDELRAFLTAT